MSIQEKVRTISDTLRIRCDRYDSDNNDDNSFSLDHETLLLHDAEMNARIHIAECRNVGIALTPASNKCTSIAHRNGRKSETYKKNRTFCPSETRNSKSFLVYTIKTLHEQKKGKLSVYI